MPVFSELEFCTVLKRVRYLEKQLEEAKALVAVLESNLIAAKKCNVNSGNEVAALASDPPDLDASNLKTGESNITMIENEEGRFMKLTMGPILIPASEFAEKFSHDIESLWAANGPRSSKVS
ncbi:hypothetical protein FGADI_2333 [Fusarium gaditjirri]|uniref:Uncharacterized protein n=1 Tax=Fusarium gaditjirri TaxID=282569 RepID=A0A8H4X1C4_9HYPO|nr:hypothetical protein FGADI_2333 [Fusarium gaditjirri]